MPTKRSKEQKVAEAAADGAMGNLTVIAQQSRFHTEMDEENALKEV